MKTSIFPGTFDPWTIGHNDILLRALKMFEHVTILISSNSSKLNRFNPRQRREIIENEIKHLDRVSVRISTEKMLVDDVQKLDSTVIIRGIRNFIDYEYEQNMAHINRSLNLEIETCIILCDSTMQYISSSAYKELLKLNSELSWMVSDEIHKAYKL